ncbi:hypothetical protein CAEBREN_16018 [Caenorhabditis brenneri]|uniref:Uncharacterized protein n=1 Tax=Caenorhabditis brenneri TaxID=135651 RepID=G0N4D0_CAEBE|nr:hypothetical protein CAEBREN_16018 [Caenorhabditis brenneri]
MFKPGVFALLLFVSFSSCQHPDSLVYNEPEVTLIGKLYCGLGKTFCASVILRQEGVPQPPFVYDLDLTNYRTISNRHAFNNTDVADSPLVTSFKINEASGEVLKNDAEFRKLIKMG